MKNLFLAACFSALALTASPVTDWAKTEIVKTQEKINFKTSGRWSGSIFDWRKSGLCEARIEDGVLVMDSTRYPEGKNAGPILTLNAVKPHPGRTVFMEIDLAANADGKQVDFFFSGSRGEKKTHYYVQKKLFVLQDRKTFRVEQALPADLNALQLRFDFPQPGVYRIFEIRYGVVEPPKVDSAVNHLQNGGAERGFYCVMPPTPERFAGTMPVIIDDREAFQGKRSFRLEGIKGAYNRLVFASVPYVIGQPVSYSVRMKAKAPTRVELMLFVSSGNAYIKNFNVGTEWKKYTLTIPGYGERQIPGIQTVGSPVANFPVCLLNPTITLPRDADTVVWADNATYQFAKETTEATEPAVWISGRMNRPEGYYPAGEVMRAKLFFEPSGADRTAEVGWKLLDSFGKEIAAGTPETIPLPLEKEFTIQPPKDVQGPMNLVFTMKTEGGDSLSHTFYSGVIESSKGLNRRLGENVVLNNPEQSRNVRKLLTDFGLGCIRVWHQDRGADAIREFHDAGFYVMYCLSFPHFGKHGPHQFFMRKDYTGYLKELEPVVRAYSGLVDTWEIFNEPNIWSGRSPNPDENIYRTADPEAVVEGTKVIAEFLRKTDPKAMISGPGCCRTNASYLENYLQMGAKEVIDVVTEHPYRELPELPDYAADLAALKKALAASGKKLSLQSTESGSQTCGSFPDNTITRQSIDLAAQDVRLALIGIANGVEHFYHFSCGGAEVQNAWNSLIGSGPDGSGHWHPGPYLYAAKTAAEAIGPRSTPSTVKLGMESRCYIFDHGDKRVAALWKWSGAPVELRFKTPVEYRNLMGSRFRGTALPLTPHPVYLASKLKTEELARLIQEAMPETGGDRLRFSAEVLNETEFGVKLGNRTARPLSGTVRASGGEQSFRDLPGEESTMLRFPLPRRISTAAQPVTVTVKTPSGEKTETFELKAIVVPQAAKNLTIDGDLSDWPANAQTLRLDHRNTQSVTKQEWSEDCRNATAEIKLCWTPEYLCLAVTVDKKGFFPNQLKPWDGDGLQLALDTIRNAVKETRGYQDDDFEYAFWLKDGVPTVLRQMASASSYDSLPKPLGVVSEVKFAVRHSGDKTVYEMAFPPFAISPFKLAAGSACRFNLIVNLNDGKQRAGWLEIAPGIGQIPKRPGLFPDLILVK